MSDQNISATPYPFYATGNDDDSFRAQLVSHAGASVERNQDAGFAAAAHREHARELQASKTETVQAKFDLVVAQKDAEIRAVERHAEVKAELAALRAEGLHRDIASMRDATLTATLLKISTKLGI